MGSSPSLITESMTVVLSINRSIELVATFHIKFLETRVSQPFDSLVVSLIDIHPASRNKEKALS